MNGSTQSPNITNCRDLRNPTVIKVVLPLLYTIVFIVGLLLNTLAAWIFCHIPNHSSFVVYLRNIITADLMMVITLPFKILSDSRLGPWQLQAFVCRYTGVIFYNSMYLSIIFLGLISFDRYLKIVQPRKSLMVQKVTFAKVISVSFWVFMTGFVLPNIILTNKTPTEKTAARCLQLKNDLGVKWHHFIVLKCQVIFWITFVLIIACYSAILKKIYWSDQKFQKDSSNVKKKANRNIFSIMGVFIVCFVPYQFIRIPYDISRVNKNDCTTYNALHYAKEATQLLCAFNVCLDPIIYFLLCKSFTKLLFKKMYGEGTSSAELSEVRSKKLQSVNISSYCRAPTKL
ncbi:P2Y purinoceptor 14-like [Heterodontus francisci]|uniref:P2Y purinoceptor 14-like n=1 Tax=Heterodontus francisci TaxID=7792 RepID=UPI00355B9AB8